jgi:hypothetical protein
MNKVREKLLQIVAQKLENQNIETGKINKGEEIADNIFDSIWDETIDAEIAKLSQ